MIVTFDGGMRILQEFTSDQKTLSKAINQANLYGAPGSNMQDAMYEIVTRSFTGVQGRKAIIVLTDGLWRARLFPIRKCFPHSPNRTSSFTRSYSVNAG